MSYEPLLPASQADADVVLNTAGALAGRGHGFTVAVPQPIEAFFEECSAKDPALNQKGRWSASAYAPDSLKWLAAGFSTGKWIRR